MKPLFLTIEGLQSFQERQEINFEKIGSDGLFGIFGPTGSGKSTIIDGMTLALYGSIVRFKDNSKSASETKDYFDMEAINKNCDSASVNFKFKVGEGIYRIERSYKIGKKSKKLSKKAVLFKVENGEEVKLAENYKDIYQEIKENILGLTLEDFTRSVVLPQGNFSQFLKLDGTEKRDMLERIFNLEKYGDILSKKANSYRYALETQIKQLDIELSAIGFNEDELCRKKEELKILENKLKELRAEDKEIKISLQEMEEIRKIENNLNELVEKKNAFDSKEEYIKNLEIKKDMIEKFTPVIEKVHTKNSYEERLKNLDEEVSQDKAKFEKGNSMLNKAKSEYTLLENQENEKEIEREKSYVSQEEFLKVSDEYSSAVKRKELSDKILRAEEGIKIINFENERTKNELSSYKENLKSLEEEAEKFKEISQEEVFKIEKIILEKENIFRNLESKEKEFLKFSNEKEDYSKSIEQKKEELLELEKIEKSYLADREKYYIFELEKNLHDGDICPVCKGVYRKNHEHSDENINFDKDKFEKVQTNIRKLTGDIHILEEKYRTAVEKERELKESISLLPEIKNSLRNLYDEKEKLNKNYNESREKKFYLEKEIKNISGVISKLELKTAKSENELNLRETALLEFKNEMEKIEESSFSIEILKENLEKLKEKNRLYQSINVELNNIRKEKKNISAKVEDWTKRTKDFETELIKKEETYKNLKQDYYNISNEIDKILFENGISDPKYIDEIESSLDEIGAIKDEIEEYKNNRISILNMILNYREQLKNRSFSKEKFENLSERGKIVNMSLEENIKNFGEITKSIEIFNQNKTRAEKILEAKQKIEKEVNPAKEMSELLKGRKFLDFLSAGKLQSITRRASETLQRITNGRYRINVDEKSDFSIIDNFSSAVRKPQSLSGGETFMVSLCLALALADQIQLKGKSSLEFFFLDEGFGTLDSELLEIVFSVLENLKAEGMTVGVITHVEEIKNRVIRKLIVSPAKIGVSGTVVKEI